MYGVCVSSEKKLRWECCNGYRPTFAMSGALAWQVNKYLIKKLFFVFWREMARGFARLSLLGSCVFCFVSFWFYSPLSHFLAVVLWLSLLPLEWFISNHFEAIGHPRASSMHRASKHKEEMSIVTYSFNEVQATLSFSLFATCSFHLPTIKASVT